MAQFDSEHLFSTDPEEEQRLQQETLHAARVVAEGGEVGSVTVVMGNLLTMFERGARLTSLQQQVQRLSEFLISEFPDRLTGGGAVDVAIETLAQYRALLDKGKSRLVTTDGEVPSEWESELLRERAAAGPDYERKHRDCATAGGVCIHHIDSPATSEGTGGTA